VKPVGAVPLWVVPLELSTANWFVAKHHRHHAPVVGHRFSLGCVDASGFLHGVAIVGRPVARLAGSPSEVLEVTRLAADGTPNVCSMLYSACARAGKAMGYVRIQTYILDSELGTTLRASGWVNTVRTKGKQWVHSDGKPRRTDQPTCDKYRWELVLNDPHLVVVQRDDPLYEEMELPL